MSGIFPENMKIILLLSSIALVAATKLDPPPRSVNVALETSFVFDPKDVNDNKSFVNHIRRFLDKLYKMFEPQMAENKFRTEIKPRASEDRPLGEENRSEGEKGSGGENGLGEFIEIMQNLGQKFLNMTAPKIQDALETIHVEVKNITKQQLPVVPQAQPNNTQVIITDLIDTWIHSKPEDIKIFVNSTLRENKPLLKTFARRMNSYYNVDDVRQLNKILKKFKRYIENNKDTTKIVKKLLHNAIFKKYDKLNETARAAVMRDLKMLSEFLIAKNSLTGPETRRNSQRHDVDKAEFSDDTHTTLRRSKDEKNRNAREQNEDKKKSINDLVVGSVELSDEPPQNS